MFSNISKSCSLFQALSLSTAFTPHLCVIPEGVILIVKCCFQLFFISLARPVLFLFFIPPLLFFLSTGIQDSFFLWWNPSLRKLQWENLFLTPLGKNCPLIGAMTLTRTHFDEQILRLRSGGFSFCTPDFLDSGSWILSSGAGCVWPSYSLSPSAWRCSMLRNWWDHSFNIHKHSMNPTLRIKLFYLLPWFKLVFTLF